MCYTFASKTLINHLNKQLNFMNITKLLAWNELQKLGFTPINYHFNGRKVCTGASLQVEIKNIDGTTGYKDIICIQPHNFKYSSGKNYHITGDINTPYYDTFYRYESGRKVELYERVERINNFFTAREILPIIKKMLK